MRLAKRKPWLVMVAAEGEAAAVARGLAKSQVGGRIRIPKREWQTGVVSDRVHLLRTGVGKVNAAAAATLVADPSTYSAVINLGIAGALPEDAKCRAFRAPLGGVVVATQSMYADEGIVTPRGYLDLAAMGFPLAGAAEGKYGFRGSVIVGHAKWRAAAAAAIGPGVVQSPVATVSTCSGTNSLAYSVSMRTGAAVEAMEGAAIAHALARQWKGRLPFVEVRVVSNTTGDRERQVWKIKEALERVSEVAAALSERLFGS